MCDIPIDLVDDGSPSPTNYNIHLYTYNYTVHRSGVLTNKQFKLVEEVRKENRKYKLIVTGTRQGLRYAHETECKSIDAILPIWFNMLATLKVKARHNNYILINNVGDEFLTIMHDLVNKQTTVYKLETE